MEVKMEFDLEIFDKKTQKKIRKEVYKVASKKASTLMKLKSSGAKNVNKPFFKTKPSKSDKVMNIFGARQNPVNDKTFTNLPTASRIPGTPHPVLDRSGKWITTKTNSDNRSFIAGLRYADTGESITPGEDTFFFSKRRNAVFSASRKFPHNIRPVETTFAGIDLISDAEWEQIVFESFEEVMENYNNNI